MAENIRNFVIISHIDHGKSTLADRFLELTGTVEKRNMKPQYLDQLELERERGITIKMAPVRMIYHPHRGMTQRDTQRIAENVQNNVENLLYGDITYKIRAAVFEVRGRLGLGHKEGIYHNALIQEFNKKSLYFETQRNIDIFYAGKKVGSYQPDFIVENKIIIEFKALPELGHPQIEQLWSYLKGSDYKLALLINFGSKELEIKRVIYDMARLPHNSASGPRESAQVEEYILNLIDTPGHSDFSYEVSRALASVEGAVLLVDVSQGVQAQTLVNLRLANEAGLAIIGAVNKIDLPGVGPEDISVAARELAGLIGVAESEIFKISGRTGEGVKELLEGVIRSVPAPEPSKSTKQGLIFDSFYDEHKGIVAFVRVFSGEYKSGVETKLVQADFKFKIKEVGYFSPDLRPADILSAGEIGYIVSGIKDLGKLKIGDTIGDVSLPGYREPKPVVFVSLYPDNPDQYDDFKSALLKLRLNDSSFSVESDLNEVLGRGFKCGFLGQLHFEITVERLEREFKIKTVATFPSVAYKFRNKSGELEIIKSADGLPPDISEIWEPTIRVSIISPIRYLGNILNLKNIFRLKDISTSNLENKILIEARTPLTALLSDFDGQLKSVSEGMASMSYELTAYEKADLEKVEILVAGDVVPGLTRLMYKDELESAPRNLLFKLKEVLPGQQFSQSLQARAGGRIVARENIPALRKDVAGYLYGGDRTRKMKLWKKQKKGKEKLKGMGRVNISASDFKKLLKK